jgi:small subunit ribosomal protein S13
MANAILRKAAINPNIRAGFLTDSDIAKVEDIIRDPARYNLPSWLFNRRKDTETGNDLHMISADLAFKTKTDIDDAKSIRCWRG